jgi:hypothetical protein
VVVSSFARHIGDARQARGLNRDGGRRRAAPSTSVVDRPEPR